MTLMDWSGTILTIYAAAHAYRLAMAPREAPKQGEGVEVCGKVDLKKREDDGEYAPKIERRGGFDRRRIKTPDEDWKMD